MMQLVTFKDLLIILHLFILNAYSSFIEPFQAE